MMKTGSFFTRLAFLLFFVAILSPFASAHHPVQQPGSWELLGSRKVNFRVDRDVIPVTVREGTFKALQIRVTDGPIDLNRVVVHYANGQEQVLNVRQNIRRGGQTRVLDLPGNNRIITKVVFIYDTDNRARRRATVALWGKR